MVDRKDIEYLYNVLLNRNADPGGLESWATYVEKYKIIKIFDVARLMI